MKSSGNARRASAPVEAGHSESRKLYGIGEIDHILSDRRLLRHTWPPRIAKARGTEAPEIRHKDSISSFDERRRHIVPCMDIIRKTMQEHDRKSQRIAALLVPDIKNSCLD